MKVFLLLVVIFWGAESYSRSALQEKWENFQVKFEKSYRSPVEAKKRFLIFEDNLRQIEEHNARFESGEVTYSKGVNKFADWTSEEFLEYVSKYEMPVPARKSGEIFKPISNSTVPDSVDWRTKGCLTGVKDQGDCGSCWAFSTTGSLEAQLFLTKGKLISLSEQNLVDCSGNQGNEGCGGGLMRHAFDYIEANGLESEADYPYLGWDDSCQFEKEKSVVSVGSHVVVPRNEADLQAAVAEVGPISIAIAASSELQLYESGILEDRICNLMSLNHGVVLVGYGSLNSQDFYIVRNSWGANWGENGYFRLGKRGSNPCGIIEDACYPKVI